MSATEEPSRPATAKQRLRAQLLAARNARRPDDLVAARAAIRSHVLARVGGINCVAGYRPLRTEPGSLELLAALHARGVRVLVPLTLPDRDLDWTLWTPDGIGDRLGPDSIADAGLVLVPALAVSADGTRLGRGGGSYDRALSRLDPATIVAALAFDEEVLPSLPCEPWDVPVTAAVTPSGWRDVARNTDVAPGR